MIGIDDSKYKKLMSGLRLDITNRDLVNDMIISDLYDENGNSKMYTAGTFENSEKIKDYIRNN
jgi:hypothetical protein